jgi:hypothetical protein
VAKRDRYQSFRLVLLRAERREADAARRRRQDHQYRFDVRHQGFLSW